MQRKSHFTPSKIWIGLEFDIRENSQKTSNEKRAPRGCCILNQTIVKFLCRFSVDGTSLLSHYVGCLGMYQALWYCLSMSLLAYQRN